MMWGIALIFISVASCNALHGNVGQKTADLLTRADNRIIGGSATTIEKYNFVVQIFNKDTQQYCGGSLVTSRHVLSAASYCFVDEKDNLMSPSSYTIRAATTILNSGGSVHYVTAIKIHELYDFETYDNDVALVLMATAVDSASVAKLAKLPYHDTVVPDGSSVIAVGWGWTDEDNPDETTDLHEVTLQKIDLTTCQDRHKLQNRTVTSNMICAGILDVGGKGMCTGDVGGPLIYNELVVGVMLRGSGCADPKYPDLYTRVATYTDWINNMIYDSLLQYGNCPKANTGNTSSPSSKVGVITLLLYLILRV